MFRKIALSLSLSLCALTALAGNAPQSFTAPPSLTIHGTVPNQLIIVPQSATIPQPVDARHGIALFVNKSYELYSVYDSQTHALVAAFGTKQAAMLYSQGLVKDGIYAGYAYTDYLPK